jgi:hypothetical protein
MMQFLTFAGVIVCFMATAPNFVSSNSSCDGCSVARKNLMRNWQIYNHEDMNNRLRSFNRRLSPASVDIPAHCNLSLSFGRLDNDSVKALDNSLKVMVFATLRAFNRDPQSKMNWRNVISTMHNNALLEEMPDESVHREDGYQYDDYTEHPLSRGQHDVDRFPDWFANFINDSVVTEDTSFDIEALLNIINEPGATSVVSRSAFSKRENGRQQIIDVSILRFPDLESPFIKVYRLKLSVWSARNGKVVVTYSNGVSGVLDSAKFIPRASVLRSIPEHLITRAVAEIDALFE